MKPPAFLTSLIPLFLVREPNALHPPSLELTLVINPVQFPSPAIPLPPPTHSHPTRTPSTRPSTPQASPTSRFTTSSAAASLREFIARRPPPPLPPLSPSRSSRRPSYALPCAGRSPYTTRFAIRTSFVCTPSIRPARITITSLPHLVLSRSRSH